MFVFSHDIVPTSAPTNDAHEHDLLVKVTEGNKITKVVRTTVNRKDITNLLVVPFRNVIIF
jgi:hypothetical protein